MPLYSVSPSRLEALALYNGTHFPERCHWRFRCSFCGKWTNETYERYVFNNRNQGANESVEDYIAVLCTLSKTDLQVLWLHEKRYSEGPNCASPYWQRDKETSASGVGPDSLHCVDGLCRCADASSSLLGSIWCEKASAHAITMQSLIWRTDKAQMQGLWENSSFQ